MWWDRSGVLSYQKLLNFVLSNRGGGKTFNCTEWAVKDFLKTGKQTMWVRRYDTELYGPKGKPAILDNNKFFDGIKKEGLFPGVELEVSGYEGKVNGEVAIYFMPLSTSRQAKSVNFPNVNKIIFDEFLVGGDSSNGYLKNEVEILLDLIETVDRLRDEVRVVLLANSISIVNPYFHYFKIKPRTDRRFTVYPEICVEIFKDAEFVEAKRKTRLGRLTAGTRYGDYAIENKWLLDNETFIEKKTPDAKFYVGLKYAGVMYGFWIDYDADRIFVNRQYDPSSYALYTLTKDDHEANLLLIKNIADTKRVERVVYAFRNGLLRFEDMQVKNQFYEFIGFFVR